MRLTDLTIVRLTDLTNIGAKRRGGAHKSKTVWLNLSLFTTVQGGLHVKRDRSLLAGISAGAAAFARRRMAARADRRRRRRDGLESRAAMAEHPVRGGQGEACGSDDGVAIAAGTGAACAGGRNGGYVHARSSLASRRRARDNRINR